MGGRAAPRWGGNEPKKTGARSARARTRGQNPLVSNMNAAANRKKGFYKSRTPKN